MNIETTHCDACDTENIGCLAHKVAGETVLAICPHCVTDEELDILVERSMLNLYASEEAHSRTIWPAPKAAALPSLFLGAWF